MMLDRRAQGAEIELRSYFESEGNVNVKVTDVWLEDDIWTSIRLNPNALPLGNLVVLPSCFHLRLSHTETKALPCMANLEASGDQLIYSLDYGDRSVKFWINAEFSPTIDKLEETAYSGWGAGRKQLTLNKQIKTDYWTKNSVSDGPWRDKLGLE